MSTPRPGTSAGAAPASVFTRSQRQELSHRPAPELHSLLMAFAGGLIPDEPADGAVVPSGTGLDLWVRDDAADKDWEGVPARSNAGMYLAIARWRRPGEAAAESWPVAWFRGALPHPIHQLARCHCPDAKGTGYFEHGPGCPFRAAAAARSQVPGGAAVRAGDPANPGAPAGDLGPAAYDGPVRWAHASLPPGEYPGRLTDGDHVILTVTATGATARYPAIEDEPG